MIPHLSGKTIHVESYGCTYNHADTQKIIEIAESQGCRQVPAEEAETIIINTCTVVASTERAMLRRLLTFAGRDLIVTGCMAKIQPDLIRTVASPCILLPEELSCQSGRIGGMVGPAVGAVQVGCGCLGHCTYCITKCARGELRSNPPDKICAEVERLALAGACEIQLTGQDVSAYGHDSGTNLAALLGAIDEIPGDFSVRVGMMNPATILPVLDDLAEAFAASKKVFRFVHIPVQSGSDRVLAAMGRGYCASDFTAIVDAFKRQIPDLRVSTDFIAGFPTETGEDFALSIDLLRRTTPTKVNITRFSSRTGTAAASLPDLPDRIKKERSRALTRAANALYDTMHAARIGRIIPVMVTEERIRGTVVARDASYHPVVIRERLPLRTPCMVEITGHSRHYLLGRRMSQ
ncbi:MAG: tRNA (N(6)-L-threonylcarbamoyladenosine(37)-C(2))-methylthiotransferase [Methanomicrobiaceae archaeon]|nr:tRNA (N(6)-L-threonylcarbamoyladenosine(37)-C(2))-methylthiotransferase [Methanomicrobiaceae archaeon]